jgi:hypothetical protein
MSYLLNPEYHVPDVTQGYVTHAGSWPQALQDALGGLASALDSCKTILGEWQLGEMLHQYWAARLQHPGVVFANGSRMSVQAGLNHYCSRSIASGPHAFTTVEVWDREVMDEPVVMTAAELMATAAARGGIKYGSIPALDFGRDPARPKRELDEAVLEDKVRKSQRTGALSLKPYKGRISKWRYDLSYQTGFGLVVGEWEQDRFRSSALEKPPKCIDGIYLFETRNSLYVAAEEDRVVAGAEVRVGNDGRVRLWVTPTPTLSLTMATQGPAYDTLSIIKAAVPIDDNYSHPDYHDAELLCERMVQSLNAWQDKEHVASAIAAFTAGNCTNGMMRAKECVYHHLPGLCGWYYDFN